MFFSRNRKSTTRKNDRRLQLHLESLEDRVVMNADAGPVLLVVGQQDFWWDDYANTRQGLESAGIEVHVAAATLDTATPHAGMGGSGIQPDLALADVNADDYSAIAFLGGWGSSAYQFGFEGTYWNDAYNGESGLRTTVNELIGDFMEQDKVVGGICFGVSVLAWSRVDGESLLAGRTVAAWHGSGPGSSIGATSDATWHYESNGATLLASGSIGDPTTSSDDVNVDGNIITAENWFAGEAFGQTIAQTVIANAENQPPETEPETPAQDQSSEETQPVLMVIANQDFYYREYSETRQGLEEAGLSVVVAAEYVALSSPHANSGQGEDGGFVMPDIAIADASADDYSAIVFVGGWGSSSYQYAYEGTYDNAAYNGNDVTQQAVNDLIVAFVEQDKYVTAICHGVSVLAYARVNGQSLLQGRTVASWAGSSPSESDGQGDGTTRWHIEQNGATMVASGSIGDPTTADDDVIVDDKVITAENYDSAYVFGQTIAQQLLS